MNTQLLNDFDVTPTASGQTEKSQRVYPMHAVELEADKILFTGNTGKLRGYSPYYEEWPLAGSSPEISTVSCLTN